MSVRSRVWSDVPTRRQLRASVRSRDRVLVALGVFALPLLLTSCADENTQETLQRVSGTEGANSLNTDILIRNARIANPSDTVGEPTFAAGSDAPLLVHLVNNTAERDRLTEVTTPAAVRVSQGNAGGGGSPVNIELPPGSDTAFRENGLSLALDGLAQPLGAGSVVEMTFSFEIAPSVTINVPVATPAEREDREAEHLHAEEGEE